MIFPLQFKYWFLTVIILLQIIAILVFVISKCVQKIAIFQMYHWICTTQGNPKGNLENAVSLVTDLAVLSFNCSICFFLISLLEVRSSVLFSGALVNCPSHICCSFPVLCVLACKKAWPQVAPCHFGLALQWYHYY